MLSKVVSLVLIAKVKIYPYQIQQSVASSIANETACLRMLLPAKLIASTKITFRPIAL